ncbi:hypothetical protein PSHT_04233 [Puccinia striiformis]|uniref:Uncharacterized protein n=1 Tax=Puccinia striiformis TaxID=27350 RepID=A0A2S4WDN5_9BASI|nr:hypothetical protein PSHT_04233 [Puccinia striiformis]
MLSSIVSLDDSRGPHPPPTKTTKAPSKRAKKTNKQKEAPSRSKSRSRSPTPFPSPRPPPQSEHPSAHEFNSDSEDGFGTNHSTAKQRDESELLPAIDPMIDLMDAQFCQDNPSRHFDGESDELVEPSDHPKCIVPLAELAALRAMTNLDDEHYQQALNILATPGGPISFLVMKELERQQEQSNTRGESSDSLSDTNPTRQIPQQYMLRPLNAFVNAPRMLSWSQTWRCTHEVHTNLGPVISRKVNVVATRLPKEKLPTWTRNNFKRSQVLCDAGTRFADTFPVLDPREALMWRGQPRGQYHPWTWWSTPRAISPLDLFFQGSTRLPRQSFDFLNPVRWHGRRKKFKRGCRLSSLAESLTSDSRHSITFSPPPLQKRVSQWTLIDEKLKDLKAHGSDYRAAFYKAILIKDQELFGTRTPLADIDSDLIVLPSEEEVLTQLAIVLGTQSQPGPSS